MFDFGRNEFLSNLWSVSLPTAARWNRYFSASCIWNQSLSDRNRNTNSETFLNCRYLIGCRVSGIVKVNCKTSTLSTMLTSMRTEQSTEDNIANVHLRACKEKRTHILVWKDCVLQNLFHFFFFHFSSLFSAISLSSSPNQSGFFSFSFYFCFFLHTFYI